MSLGNLWFYCTLHQENINQEASPFKTLQAVWKNLRQSLVRRLNQHQASSVQDINFDQKVITKQTSNVWSARDMSAKLMHHIIALIAKKISSLSLSLSRMSWISSLWKSDGCVDSSSRYSRFFVGSTTWTPEHVSAERGTDSKLRLEVWTEAVQPGPLRKLFYI